tara:strand:+ start:2619 stop:2720 length:102 start_codon:yes stop_codon:yes gene_type:complete
MFIFNNIYGLDIIDEDSLLLLLLFKNEISMNSV